MAYFLVSLKHSLTLHQALGRIYMESVFLRLSGVKHPYKYANRFLYCGTYSSLMETMTNYTRIYTRHSIPVENYSDFNILNIYKTHCTMKLFYYIAFKHHLNPETVYIISLKGKIISKIVLSSPLYLHHYSLGIQIFANLLIHDCVSMDSVWGS